MLEDYPQDVKVVFKHFPLRSHKYAVNAAIATIAAQDQGKFWEFHDLLFKNYKKLDDEKIDAFVDQLGLDREAFDERRKDPASLKQVRKDYDDGIAAGVGGTPTIFVNGRKLKGRNVETLKAMVAEELAKSEGKKASGG